jgi:hypothetical protein
MGEGGFVMPVWRIDDGPVHGLNWETCRAVMDRSEWSVQHGFPPSWPSQLPESCANESYLVDTTYATTEMLTAGDHTLYHGLVAMSGNRAYHDGWIK